MSKNKKLVTTFNEEGISNAFENKHVVCEIINAHEKNIYTGLAKRWSVKERLLQHI